jgi:hypothetical protein
MSAASTRRHLTDRDVEILQALDRCPLTAQQFLKLSQAFAGQCFTSIRSVQDRLQKLRQAGWIQGWPYAFPVRGGSPDYYRLTLLGFRLLHGEHTPSPAKRHFSELHVARHHHSHSLAEFLVHTLTAAHRRRILLKNFYRENTLPLPVAGVVAYPDSVFELHMTDGRQFNFLVELDNGTERLRSDKDTESWQKKIRLYNLLQDRTYPDRFRLLVVCTRCSGRLRAILDLAAQHATNPHRALLYGVHLDDYLREPDALCAPCFRNHRHEAVALVSGTTTVAVAAHPAQVAVATPSLW